MTNSAQDTYIYDTSRSDRLSSVRDFVLSYGQVALESKVKLLDHAKTVIKDKYHLSDVESIELLNLFIGIVGDDFTDVNCTKDTLIYVILGHDLENIKLNRTNEYNWLYNSLLDYFR